MTIKVLFSPHAVQNILLNNISTTHFNGLVFVLISFSAQQKSNDRNKF